MPENLKKAGYATAMFGKWHLGMGRQEWTPPRRGFDEHMGYYDGCGTRYTHVQSCCGYQPDQRNAGGTNPYPAAGVPFKFHFGAPSCVPATPFETAGATLNAVDVAALLDDRL